MWLRLALAGFAIVAALAAAGSGAAAQRIGAAPIPAAEQAGLPTFTPPGAFVRGDLLDAWCKGPTTALNIAVCSDDQLRALAIERLRAFDDARTRIGVEQQRELAADQNGWAMSYPQGCGLPSNVMPRLPLAPSVKECLAKAGRERLTYLQAYGTAGAGATPPSSEQAAAPPRESQLTSAAVAPFAPNAGTQSQTATPPSPGQSDAKPSQAPSAPASVAQNAGRPMQSATEGQPQAASGSRAIQIPPAQAPASSAAQVPAPSAAQQRSPAVAQISPAAPRETPTSKPAANAPGARNRLPEWGTWRGYAALGAVVIGVFCIGLWVGAAVKMRRRGKGPEPSGAMPASRDGRW